MVTMNEYLTEEALTCYKDTLDKCLHFEEVEGAEDMMPAYRETLDEGVVYTEEDINMIVEGNLDTGGDKSQYNNRSLY